MAPSETRSKKGETVATIPVSASAAADSADAAHTVAHAVDAANVVNHAQHLGANIIATTFTNLVGMVGIAASGVVSFVINHSAFKERREQLVDKYRWFLASRYDKEPEAVNSSDLESFAHENPTVEQALGRARTIRNVHTSALLAASCVAALVLTAVLMTPALPLAGWAAAAAGSAFLSVATLKVAAAALAISYTTTKIGSKILSSLGLKAMKADSPTAQDYIDHMTQLQAEHKPVTEEMVFGAYVASDPFAMEQVRQTFKQPFHKLSDEDKATVIQTMQEDELFDHMNLKELTAAINERRLDPKSLTFYAHEQQGLVEQTLEHIRASTLQQQMGNAAEKVQNAGRQVAQAGQHAIHAGRDVVQGAADTTRQWAQSIRPQPQQQPVQPRSIAPDAVRDSRTGPQIGA